MAEEAIKGAVLGAITGTIVATFLGFTAIESIQPGDYVLAKDVDTGIVSYEPVL